MYAHARVFWGLPNGGRERDGRRIEPRPELLPNIPSGFAFLLLLPCLLASLVAAPVRAAGPELAGSYRIEQVTNLGGQVRVTLHVRLVNNSQGEVFVTQAALETRSRKQGPAAAAAVVTRLAPRESTTLEQQVVVSRAEYESWTKGERPSLRVALRPGTGNAVTRTISLGRLAQPRVAQ